MPSAALDTIDELLQDAQDEVDDSETTYKLRSARQLVHVLRERHRELDAALDETIPDEQMVDNLRELGYLD